jgi:hypothetical protein
MARPIDLRRRGGTAFDGAAERLSTARRNGFRRRGRRNAGATDAPAATDSRAVAIGAQAQEIGSASGEDDDQIGTQYEVAPQDDHSTVFLTVNYANKHIAVCVLAAT